MCSIHSDLAKLTTFTGGPEQICKEERTICILETQTWRESYPVVGTQPIFLIFLRQCSLSDNLAPFKVKSFPVVGKLHF